MRNNYRENTLAPPPGTADEKAPAGGSQKVKLAVGLTCLLPYTEEGCCVDGRRHEPLLAFGIPPPSHILAAHPILVGNVEID